jgi:glycosyltransferase involved in cell wall biosynthesis
MLVPFDSSAPQKDGKGKRSAGMLTDQTASRRRASPVSYLLFAYNQRHYIRYAVDSAFKQTYEPLEIILSDDCSTDGTFEIMEAMVRQYNGTKKVVLRKNPSRLGVTGHVNAAIAAASGEFLVLAAGDDISLPERTAVSHSLWAAKGSDCAALFTDALIIDALGNVHGRWFGKEPSYARNLDDFMRLGECWVLGCSHAFDKKLFQKYGPIGEGMLQEDGAIAFRAILEGMIFYINAPLVKYRRHQDNIYDLTKAKRVKALAMSDYLMRQEWLRCAIINGSLKAEVS